MSERPFIPNTFPTPNVIVEQVMARVKGPAFKVLLAITRGTLGWHDWRPGLAVELSLKDLQTQTGLSRQGVIDALRELTRLQLVEIRKAPRNTRVPNSYTLNLDITTGKLVHNLDQSKSLTSPTSQRSRPKLVNNSDSLKYKRNTNKGASRKKRERADSDPRVKTLLTTFQDRYFSRTGTPYALSSPGKDCALLKSLLTCGHDVPEIEAAMDLYFASDFYSKTDFL
jgi:hypothetical protein